MTLHVETRGAGVDVVLLHGWGMNGAVWGDLAARLAARFRVHAVDLPGHGASPACDPYTLEQLARTIAAAMPRRVVVCGWSLGGLVALVWALAAPLQIARLALIGTTPCFVARDGWRCAVAAEVFDAFARDVSGDAFHALVRFIALQALGDAAARGAAARLRASIASRDRPDTASLAAGLALLRDTDLRGELARVTQPALVVHGEHDALAPLAAAEHLARALPHARLEVVRGAAHAPFVMHAAAISGGLADFLHER